jgi:hypothetical protein
MKPTRRVARMKDVHTQHLDAMAMVVGSICSTSLLVGRLLALLLRKRRGLEED